jgi:hypothetical protein
MSSSEAPTGLKCRQQSPCELKTMFYKSSDFGMVLSAHFAPRRVNFRRQCDWNPSHGRRVSALRLFSGRRIRNSTSLPKVSQKNARMYGVEWWPHYAEQKEAHRSRRELHRLRHPGASPKPTSARRSTSHTGRLGFSAMGSAETAAFHYRELGQADRMPTGSESCR